MFKKIILGGLFLLSLQNFAQEGTASPYSFHGVGDVKYKGTIESRSMGAVGILIDSLQINMQNPATLPGTKFSSFGVGATFRPQWTKSGAVTEKAQRTTYDYLTLAIPAGKWGFGLGLHPYSYVGYKIIKKDEVEAYKYDGVGGLNQTYFALGYRVNSKLTFGANVQYTFGKTERNVTFFRNDVQNGINENNVSTYGGVGFNVSSIFKTKIHKLDFLASAAFSSSTRLIADNTRVTGLATVVNGSIVVFDEKESDIPNTRMKLPSTLTFSSGIGKSKKWFVGMESAFLSKPDIDFDASDDAVFESAAKFGLGGYFIPKYDSFSNYFSRVAYRAGFRMEQTGLVVSGKSIKDQALTFGFGFPLGNYGTSANLGFELGKKGTTIAGLVQEKYANISIGLIFNDRWFVKRKYD